MQLVAYGAQDIYITGNPQITFFKVVYRRHTNFAIESIEQTFNGTVGFGKKVSATISRNGDLITDCWLEVKMTKDGSTWFPVEELLSTVELEIGGQRIDKHYSDWFRVYSEIFRRSNEKEQYKRLVDFVDGETDGAGAIPNVSKRFYFPLIFFFNKNPGLALPLIALQYHEVKLNFELKGAVAGIDETIPLTFQLYVDYVYLDTDERRRFAQVSHEYLIEQLQFTGDESITIASTKKTQNIRLNYNHPVKALFWVCYATSGQFGVYTGDGSTNYLAAASTQTGTLVSPEAFAPIYDVKLQLNGHDRFSTRKGSYFNLVQPFQTCKSYPQAGVYMYSFALKPAEHQPSGTCNFSRIDNATLNLTFKEAKDGVVANVSQVLSEDMTCAAAASSLNAIKIFAVNYNVLRIMSGMGGLAYSN